MSFDLSKAVLRPDEGEVLAVGPPDTVVIVSEALSASLRKRVT